MKRFNGSGLGRVVLINLYRGDKLLESVRDQLKEAAIENAVILCAIGSLKKARFHRVTSTEAVAVDECLEFEQPMELASLQGVIINGEPHFHMVTSDLGAAYTGHLEEGTEVLYRAEIVVAEMLDLNIKRVKDSNGNEIFVEA